MSAKARSTVSLVRRIIVFRFSLKSIGQLGSSEFD